MAGALSMHLPMPFAHQRWRQDTFCNEELLSSLWIFCAFSMQQHQVVSEGSLKFIARLCRRDATPLKLSRGAHLIMMHRKIARVIQSF